MADRLLDDLTAEIVRCHRIIEDVSAERDRERARRLRAEAALDAILDGARDPISVAQQARRP